MRHYVLLLICLLHISLNARQIVPQLSSPTKQQLLVIRLRGAPWTPKDLQELEAWFKVKNIASFSTLFNILINSEYEEIIKDLVYSKESSTLYNIFVSLVAENVITNMPNFVVAVPSVKYFQLLTVLLAGAQPNPSYNDIAYWPSLQQYMMSGKPYESSLRLLLDFGANPNDLPARGTVPALFFALWQFFNNGEEFVHELIIHGADVNATCPFNYYPSTLASTRYPVELFLGFYIDTKPLDVAVINIVEQWYLYFSDLSNYHDRMSLIETCQKLITTLINHEAKASSKAQLKDLLKQAVKLLSITYPNVESAIMNDIVNFYSSVYGS